MRGTESSIWIREDDTHTETLLLQCINVHLSNFKTATRPWINHFVEHYHCSNIMDHPMASRSESPPALVPRQHIQDHAAATSVTYHWGYATRVVPCVNDAGSCKSSQAAQDTSQRRLNNILTSD